MPGGRLDEHSLAAWANIQPGDMQAVIGERGKRGNTGGSNQKNYARQPPARLHPPGAAALRPRYTRRLNCAASSRAGEHASHNQPQPDLIQPGQPDVQRADVEKGKGQRRRARDNLIDEPEQRPADPANDSARYREQPSKPTTKPINSSRSRSGSISRLVSGAISESWPKLTAWMGSVASCAAMVTASNSAPILPPGKRSSERASQRASSGASSTMPSVPSSVS